MRMLNIKSIVENKVGNEKKWKRGWEGRKMVPGESTNSVKEGGNMVMIGPCQVSGCSRGIELNLKQLSF